MSDRNPRKSFPGGPFDERGVGVPVFAVEDDLAAVRVFQADRAASFRRRRDAAAGQSATISTGLVCVFLQEILDGIEVMHAHVAQPAAVVIPVAAERLMDAVGMIGLERARAPARNRNPAPWARAGAGGRSSRSSRISSRTRDPADRRFERPAEQPVLDDFLDRLDGRAEAVELVFGTGTRC